MIGRGQSHQVALICFIYRKTYIYTCCVTVMMYIIYNIHSNMQGCQYTVMLFTFQLGFTQHVTATSVPLPVRVSQVRYHSNIFLTSWPF